ncbi:MAG: heparan-alpha-glucosaminide N-acetyltransferase domain-containing protein [Bacteroidota bacterium]
MSRLYALDLARFVAMLLMIQGHVLDALVMPSVIDVTQPPWNIWSWIRGLTAPVFLTVSGAVHVFAAKRNAEGRILDSTLERRMRWAVTILVIGYLLVFPGKRVIDLPYVTSEGWHTFFAVNILQLVGAAMSVFVAVMQSTRSVADMGRRAALAAALILACSPLAHLDVVHAMLPIWLQPYLTSQYGSLFPFFPFATYLFLGVVIGARLHALPSEERDARLVQMGVRFGIPLAILGYGLLYGLVAMGVSQKSIDNADSVLLVAARFGAVLVIFAGAVKLLRLTWRLRSSYILFGSKSLYIYVIHVVLLFGTPWWDGIGRTQAKSMTLGKGLAALLVILAATLALAWLIDKYQHASIAESTRRRLRAVMVGMLIVVFSIAW